MPAPSFLSTDMPSLSLGPSSFEEQFGRKGLRARRMVARGPFGNEPTVTTATLSPRPGDALAAARDPFQLVNQHLEDAEAAAAAAIKNGGSAGMPMGGGRGDSGSSGDGGASNGTSNGVPNGVGSATSSPMAIGGSNGLHNIWPVHTFGMSADCVYSSS